MSILKKLDRRRAFSASLLIMFLSFFGAGIGWLVGQFVRRPLTYVGAGIGAGIGLLLVVLVLSDSNN